MLIVYQMYTHIIYSVYWLRLWPDRLVCEYNMIVYQVFKNENIYSVINM